MVYVRRYKTINIGIFTSFTSCKRSDGRLDEMPCHTLLNLFALTEFVLEAWKHLLLGFVNF